MADYTNTYWHTDCNATATSGDITLWNVWIYNEHGNMIVVLQTPSYEQAQATVRAHNVRLVH